MAIASTVPVLMAGRFIIGFGVGMASLVVPVYLSEVSPQQVRGTVVAIDIMLVTFGQVVSAVICLSLGHDWRMMLGLAGIPSAIQFIGMFYMPESPRWLAFKNKKKMSRKVL